MSLVTSRRSLIIGAATLIAAPCLVRATSLMHLRGYEMDPYVLAFLGDGKGPKESQYSNTYNIDRVIRPYDNKAEDLWRSLSVKQQLEVLRGNATTQLARNEWDIIRRSELTAINSRERSIPCNEISMRLQLNKKALVL